MAANSANDFIREHPPNLVGRFANVWKQADFADLVAGYFLMLLFFIVNRARETDPGTSEAP
jgi:hypothetical protein